MYVVEALFPIADRLAAHAAEKLPLAYRPKAIPGDGPRLADHCTAGGLQ